MTSPLAQIFASMISQDVTGMTSRCSSVPCSRSRITAAPPRMIASMVTLSMICMTARNQLEWRFGLYMARICRLTGAPALPSARPTNVSELGVDDALDVAGAGAGDRHRGRIDIELQDGIAPGQHVFLEARWDVEHEGVAAGIHGGVDPP